MNMFTLCTGTLNTYIIFICNLFTLFVFACLCVSFFCLWGVCSTVGRLDVKKERKEKVTTNKQQRKKRKKEKEKEKKEFSLLPNLHSPVSFPLQFPSLLHQFQIHRSQKNHTVSILMSIAEDKHRNKQKSLR